MTERKAITEADKDIIDSWYKMPEGDVECIDTFIKHLNDDYQHDYGTICHAVAAAAIRAAWAMNAKPQGGITGFQASAVMWEFIRNWTGDKGPMQLIKLDDMLFPQMEYKFAKTISTDTWNYLKYEAQKHINEVAATGNEVHPSVWLHWQSIVNGIVPFGYTVSDD